MKSHALRSSLETEAHDRGIDAVLTRTVEEHARAEYLLAEKRALEVEVAELRFLAAVAPDGLPVDVWFSPEGAIGDALTSAYGRSTSEGKVLRQVAGGMAARVVLWLDRAGYQIVASSKGPNHEGQ